LKHDYLHEVDNVKNLVISLCNTIEALDEYTDGHTRRVGDISRKLAEKMGIVGEKLDSIEIAGIIHDIGKVGISDSILNKPGKLTDDEFEEMKRHTIIGETIIKPLNCLSDCVVAVRHHHEKPNGKGYPDGLKGDEISIESRILAVADVFDALNSDRPYRSKLPMDQIRDKLKNEAETGSLDASITKLMLELVDSGIITDILA
jgi:putative two-component system response regulator